jgi:transposase-like protein
LWVAAVARELGISKTLVHRWSSKHDWLERAEAFDRADYQRRLEANIAQSVEMQTRHTAIAKEALAKCRIAIRRLDLAKVRFSTVARLLAASLMEYRARRQPEPDQVA